MPAALCCIRPIPTILETDPDSAPVRPGAARPRSLTPRRRTRTAGPDAVCRSAGPVTIGKSGSYGYDDDAGRPGSGVSREEAAAGRGTVRTRRAERADRPGAGGYRGGGPGEGEVEGRGAEALRSSGRPGWPSLLTEAQVAQLTAELDPRCGRAWGPADPRHLGPARAAGVAAPVPRPRPEGLDGRVRLLPGRSAPAAVLRARAERLVHAGGVRTAGHAASRRAGRREAQGGDVCLRRPRAGLVAVEGCHRHRSIATAVSKVRSVRC